MFFILELFSECIQSQVWYNSQGIQKITLLKHFYKHGNPGNIYTQDELGILRLVRNEQQKGRALSFDDDGHCMTALDTKLHNGKWFVLMGS